ncbi:HD domain-containing protein [Microcoleus asticus]|uniref:Bifunctional (P)ppGpp synthase/hydrolase RelA n=1 Tax=Microcoleus asticus IPMA8 TaxID=2563858 RepID=A0ABX2D0L7_9CYAN|nr:HD domain-containing protein [Microcoleus asticus]NQE35507.1 Bifunctional (p)ppGpp synthase/hydrolase RelA [Microcoleus asticus IPMA8]
MSDYLAFPREGDETIIEKFFTMLSNMNFDYELLLQRAIAIAAKAHEGQVDKAGNPYFDHPLFVMENVNSIDQKIVAVLHDAVEDSELTLEQLRSEGFPEVLVSAIEAITKIEGEAYAAYLERVIANPIALPVKIADVSHNLDLRRIANPTEADFQRMAKYKKVLSQLRAALK